jgi:stage V sporulation protein B
MTGYFIAAQRIGTLAGVEVCEQLVSMAVTLGLLHFYAGEDSIRSCLCVILGSGAGSCVTLTVLAILRMRERVNPGPRIPMGRRLWETALPLAVADDLRTGISTVENLMVPKRLALYPLIPNPLAAFGLISGMVFPILMFPACILFGLAELLIPELARCAASGSDRRIHYLVGRSLRIALLYGVFFGGVMFLAAEPLCIRLYGSEEAGKLLRLYALLVPMLYSDAITDAMTKGLGQQKACVRYNILTNSMDVGLLYLLLPRYGLQGYFFSFLITHLLNFGLSLRRLLKITGLRLPVSLPVRAILAAAGAIWVTGYVQFLPGRLLAYPTLLLSALYLLGVVSREDIQWLKGLTGNKK